MDDNDVKNLVEYKTKMFIHRVCHRTLFYYNRNLSNPPNYTISTVGSWLHI